ncbi:hypothetical protein BDW75DRAFT_200827 [Aspergillus navahoensis]
MRNRNLRRFSCLLPQDQQPTKGASSGLTGLSSEPLLSSFMPRSRIDDGCQFF